MIGPKRYSVNYHLPSMFIRHEPLQGRYAFSNFFLVYLGKAAREIKRAKHKNKNAMCAMPFALLFLSYSSSISSS